MTASYAFLPWVRQGLAGGISRVDGDATAAPRASVGVTVVVDAAGDQRPVTTTLALFGPGEVGALNPQAVLRVAPKPGELDAEPNELPMVEFAEADLPWRYTAATAAAHDRLRPWLVLAILTADEITDSAPAGADGRLPAITVAAARALPPLDQAWAWAHVQVAGFDPATETLGAIVDTEPTRVRSRLLAPRHLLPRTEYTAVLVPTFERGRLAGLREPVPDTVDSLAPAWSDGASAVRLPVYYQWSFATGDQADFEQLARRLTGRVVDAGVGVFRLDARTPDPALPPAASQPLAGTAALTNPTATPGPWPDAERSAFVTALAGLLNQPAQALTAAGTDPIVAPPLWGQWHAAVNRLDPSPQAAAGAQPAWFHQVNADPRLRVAAGLGAEVVRRHDEALMAAAWDQVEGILAANAALRRAQLAREASARLLDRHLSTLDSDTLLQVTAPVQARVAAAPAPAVPGANPALSTRGVTPRVATVHERFRASPIPAGALDVQLRRLRRRAAAVRPTGSPPPTGPPGPIGLPPHPLPVTEAALGVPASTGPAVAHLVAPAGPAAAVPTPTPAPGLLDRLNQRTLRPRPPVPTPDGMLILQRETPPGRPPVLDPGLLSGGLATTFGPATAGPAATAVTAHPQALPIRPGGGPGGTGPGGTGPGSGGAGTGGGPVVTPPAPGQPGTGSWRPGTAAGTLGQVGLPVNRPLPVGGDPTVDPASAAAVTRFQQAFTALTSVISAPPEPGPVLVQADLPALTTTVLSTLDPRVTIVDGLRSRLRLAPWVTWNSPDPLEAIMAAPEFDAPMYEPLAELGHDWLLPGAGTIPADTVTLVRSNQSFVEAYLLGLSHEMARELLFHEYPTDQRGTYFRQFWDVRGAVNPDGTPIDPQTLHDIKPIPQWDAGQGLGVNSGRTPPAPPDHVVLLIKGELLRRFPNTIVSAVAAAVVSGQRTLGSTTKMPIFSGRLDPDLSFFGFDLQPDDARGGDGHGEGWFFVLAEHPSEPRFGLGAPDDDPAASARPPVAWTELGWAHTATDGPALAALSYLDLNADLPDTSAVVPAAGDPVVAWHADRGHGAVGASGADLAWITLRRPFRVGIHGSDLLPSDVPSGGPT
jgi:hypothetical protein